MLGVKWMFRIGEFAKMTGISIHMLRNYDTVGLLVPDQVDEQTGYRYYSSAQIIKANQIQVLKQLGFGLKEIKRLQEELDSEEKLKAFLKGKISEKTRELENIKQQIERMQKAVEEIEDHQMKYALEVNIKVFPSRNVVSLREDISDFPEEGRLWEKLTNLCQRQQVRMAEAEYSFAITHEIDFEHSRIDTEVQFVVDRLYKGLKGMKSFTIPECQVATIAFKGEYMQIGNIKAYMNKWLKENGYMITGEIFSTYYRSPGNESNPNQFITELCFPIKN